MSRVTKVEGELGTRRAGTVVEAEYDVPADAWYFAANGHPTMPWCVLLEALLQPCGWLALASGDPLDAEQALSFRNLDGTGTPLQEVRPGDGPVRTRVRLRDVSSSAGIWLLSFDVAARVGDEPLLELRTGFGFFPAPTLAAAEWACRPAPRARR